MADLATYMDCQTRWGRTLITGEILQVEAYLNDASALVLDVADMTTPWTSATLPGTVLSVICEVARRVFDNPAGLQGETTGGYTWRGVKSAETSSVYLTADERRTVRRAAGRLGIGTVTLSADIPWAPSDPRYGMSAYMNDEGVVIVNSPEPEDL